MRSQSNAVRPNDSVLLVSKVDDTRKKIFPRPSHLFVRALTFYTPHVQLSVGPLSLFVFSSRVESKLVYNSVWVKRKRRKVLKLWKKEISKSGKKGLASLLVYTEPVSWLQALSKRTFMVCSHDTHTHMRRAAELSPFRKWKQISFCLIDFASWCWVTALRKVDELN